MNQPPTNQSLANQSLANQPGAAPEAPNSAPPAPLPSARPREIGGPAGPEPTRYGDWERNGRCTDF